MVMPKAYEGNEPYIFISYAHKDSDRVIPIIQALQDRGFRVWFDAGIEAGSEWPAYIAMHLMNCGCFIPFLTQNYMASDNCRQEIYFALRKKRSLLPVYLEDAELDIGLEMQLSPIQALMLQNAQGTDALLQEMYKSTKLKPCMGNAPAPAAKSAPKPAPDPHTPAEKHAAVAEKKPASSINHCRLCGGPYSSADTACPYCGTPVASSPAELYERGKALYDRKEYQEAFYVLREAAEFGQHADAQYLIGDIYYYGYYLGKDYKSAVDFWTRAANQGHPGALNTMGFCYHGGVGVSKDFTKAVQFYRKAMEKGSVKAIRNLGLCYLRGEGVSKDLSEAVRLFRLAAEQGHTSAMNDLGCAYENGDGVSRDLDAAFRWFDKAASNGSAAGAYNLGRFYEQKKCFMAQIVDDPMGLAKKWYQTAAERGSAAAKNRLRQLS